MKYTKSFFSAFLALLLSFFFNSCSAFEIITINDDYFCEIFTPDDQIPKEALEEAMCMYYEAYLYPPQHEETPVEQLGIDQNLYNSYPAYINDMFKRDFSSYVDSEEQTLHYFQLRCQDGSIVGVAAVLEENNRGFYYLDHIGIHKDFRFQGLASTLLSMIKNQLNDYVEITLDTRVFNLPAQALYEKWGFEKLSSNPNPAKQNTHYYCLRR